MLRRLTIDVHTHVYPLVYMEMLRSRTSLPRTTMINGSERLLILPEETAGRPIGSEFWSLQHKIDFMDTHGIRASVISLANPWLDFLDDGATMASKVNDSLEEMCDAGNGRLYCFGVLPVDTGSAVKELERIATLPHMRGVICGTSGLDDPAKDEIWEVMAEHEMMLFIHPHYVVGKEEIGDSFGHAVDLALGFPFDTSIGIAKMILTGVLERHPSLRVLAAHAGGTLPYLAGRLDSCVDHDHILSQTPLSKKPSEYLKMLYYDAISYQTETLKMLMEFCGPERIMFGTDHPFFSPIAGIDATPWASVTRNYDALPEDKSSDLILYENAQRLLRIPDVGNV